MGRGRDIGRRRFLAPWRWGWPGHVTAGPREGWRSGGARAECGALRTHRPGGGRGTALPERKFPWSWLREGAGRAGWNMNVFRILGDLSHLLAMILLLGKIWRSKCCKGEGRPRRAVGDPGVGTGLGQLASPASLQSLGAPADVCSGWRLGLEGD